MTNNPFKGPCYNGHQLYHMTSVDRINMVKTFNAEQCAAALTVPGIQKTVANAVQTRLRRIERGEA